MMCVRACVRDICSMANDVDNLKFEITIGIRSNKSDNPFI
jgi:hypothetical protein